MVKGTRLEIESRVKPTVGSNPTPSAISRGSSSHSRSTPAPAAAWPIIVARTCAANSPHRVPRPRPPTPASASRTAPPRCPRRAVCPAWVACFPPAAAAADSSRAVRRGRWGTRARVSSQRRVCASAWHCLRVSRRLPSRLRETRRHGRGRRLPRSISPARCAGASVRPDAPVRWMRPGS